MKQALNQRLRELLTEEELPLFLAAVERMGANPRKSLRISKRLAPEKETAIRILEEEGVRLEGETPFCDRGYFFEKASISNPGTHPLVASGLIYIQEASAMEVVERLEVAPGMRVLDLCAAPGGKSTHILDHLQGSGFLVANEWSRERVKKLDAMLARWGYLNLAVTSLSGEKAGEYFAATFDRVLVDAPCSSETFFAKRKESRKDVSERESFQFQKMQKPLLRAGFRALRNGGRLVYSTCTYSRIENEDVVEEFLREEPNAELKHIVRRWPHRDGVPGGFFAVLEKTSKNSESVDPLEMDEAFMNRIHSLTERVRIGCEMWSGEQSEYASAMAGDNAVLVPEVKREIQLSTRDAIRFFGRQWDGDRSKEKCLLRWRGFPIGLFQYGRGIHSYLFPSSL